MRFRARYAEDPKMRVGQRVVFNPDALVEEWSMGVLQRPIRLTAVEPRPGDVIKTIDPRPQDGRDWWEVWAEDPDRLASTVGAVLTVIGRRVLAPAADVKALLEHLCSDTIRNDMEGAEVAAAVTPWLAEKFPGLAYAEEFMPDYDGRVHDWQTLPALYDAWQDGVAAALGYRLPEREVMVPVPPFTFTRARTMRNLSEFSGNLHIRPDVLNRLHGGSRAN